MASLSKYFKAAVSPATYGNYLAGSSLFKPGTGPGPVVSPAYESQRPYWEKQYKDISAFGESMNPYTMDAYNRMMAFGTGSDTTSEEKLFDLAQRRFKEGTLPQFAAAGLATSGAGLKALQEGVGDLSTKFSERAFEREQQRQMIIQQATQMLSALKGLPLEMQQQLISALLGAPISTPAATPSIFGQITGALGGYQNAQGAGGTGLMGLGAALA